MFIRKARKENSPLCLQIFSTRGLVLKKVWPLRRWGSETQNRRFVNWVDKVANLTYQLS